MFMMVIMIYQLLMVLEEIYHHYIDSNEKFTLTVSFGIISPRENRQILTLWTKRIIPRSLLGETRLEFFKNKSYIEHGRWHSSDLAVVRSRRSPIGSLCPKWWSTISAQCQCHHGTIGDRTCVIRWPRRSFVLVDRCFLAGSSCGRSS